MVFSVQLSLRKENGSFGFVVRGGSHEIPARFRPFTVVYVDKVIIIIIIVTIIIIIICKLFVNCQLWHVGAPILLCLREPIVM